MTANEAIRALCSISVPSGNLALITTDVIEALSMAIDALRLPPLAEGLDEAAYQVVYDMSHDWLYDNATWGQVQDAFKAGAEWMAGQFEKNRLEALSKVKALRDAQNAHAKTMEYGLRNQAIRLGKEVDEMLDKLKIK